MKPIIIYGPQGSGKTRYASQIAKHYGKRKIIDDADQNTLRTLPANAIAFTNEVPQGMSYLHIDEALREINRQPTTNAASTERRLE